MVPSPSCPREFIPTQATVPSRKMAQMWANSTAIELCCQEMRTRLLPLHPDWGTAILRGITLQEAANQRVIEVAAQTAGPKVNEAEVAEVRDTIVRFGSWL